MLDKQKREIFCEAIRKGCTYKAAASAVGVCEKTIYNWFRKGREATRKNDKYKWLAVAATVAILLSAGLWFLTTIETQENIQIVTTEETIYEQLLIEDWEEDESIIVRLPDAESPHTRHMPEPALSKSNIPESLTFRMISFSSVTINT